MESDLFARIEACSPEFSKGQRAIASFLTAHHDKAAYMTAGALGRTVGVSESTIVRFAAELGYEGYPQMQKALRASLRSTMTSLQRMDLGGGKFVGGDYLKSVLLSDLDNLRATLDNIDRAAFAEAVEAVLHARCLYIMGARSSAILASFLHFYLKLLLDPVRLVHPSADSEMLEQVMRIGPEDVLIGISFPRYSRHTVQTMRYARDQGARVIALTDTERSPLCSIASLVLLAGSDMVSFVDSLVAPMSVLNALIVEVAMRNREEVSDTFARLEGIWDRYEVYEKGR